MPVCGRTDAVETLSHTRRPAGALFRRRLCGASSCLLCAYYHQLPPLNSEIGVNSSFLNSTSEPSACRAIWPWSAVQSKP